MIEKLLKHCLLNAMATLTVPLAVFGMLTKTSFSMHNPISFQEIKQFEKVSSEEYFIRLKECDWKLINQCETFLKSDELIDSMLSQASTADDEIKFRATLSKLKADSKNYRDPKKEAYLIQSIKLYETVLENVESILIDFAMNDPIVNRTTYPKFFENDQILSDLEKNIKNGLMEALKAIIDIQKQSKTNEPNKPNSNISMFSFFNSSKKQKTYYEKKLENLKFTATIGEQMIFSSNFTSEVSKTLETMNQNEQKREENYDLDLLHQVSHTLEENFADSFPDDN
jgi:hypothetical protein